MIFLSGKGLSSFSINNRTNVFGEKKSKMKVSGLSFLENTSKNFKLNLVLVLVLKSKAL